MTNDDNKTRLFTMRMNEQEHRRLELLADHYGINAAAVLRMLMKDRARDLGVQDAPARDERKPAAKKRGRKR